MGGNQSTPKISQQDRAILDLKLQRDKVKQYQKKIQGVLDREHEIAKQHLAAGQKDRAVFALRKRKYQETLLAKTYDQLESLEKLVSTIEFSLVEVSVLHGLKQGNEVLKEIHKEMNIQDVEKLLDETAEARAYQREIDEMLANNLTAEDEDAVQAELQQLQKEMLGDVEAEAPKLPSVPTKKPVSAVPETDEIVTETSNDRERIPIPA
ncbi:Vacuolar protein sorting-associated protein 20 [Steccherinum ochraceum]|uniref:Vacuolar protein sorting-associated protein 20 n=1 Tax=Steccherinum ochraceum TaxID=92696 RepID=A0A4V2MXF7_9APHY|nr:Vacuolar protein sorting-associated protein 20 [Steccherinum ochraceum]